MSTGQLLVRAILDRPHEHDWSIHDLGMLRLCLSDEVELHVWDSRYRVAGDAEPRTRPWCSRSEVVCGVLAQHYYGLMDPDGEPYVERELRNGFETGSTNLVLVKRMRSESIRAGGSCYQYAQSLHATSCDDGTVMLVTREQAVGSDRSFAYTREGEELVPRSSRPAARDEVSDVCSCALERWL